LACINRDPVEVSVELGYCKLKFMSFADECGVHLTTGTICTLGGGTFYLFARRIESSTVGGLCLCVGSFSCSMRRPGLNAGSGYRSDGAEGDATKCSEGGYPCRSHF
jgi:hypothetical protein